MIRIGRKQALIRNSGGELVMKLAAAVPATPAPLNGRHPPGSDISVSHATRYLSAAAHLRRPMLPDKITESGLLAARQPMPVGRTYAKRVLRDAEGLVPVSAVDIDEVKKHCRIALWQTRIRDGAAIAVLIASAFLEPWGTAITFGLVVAAIVLVGRVRLSSPLTIAAVIGITLGLMTGGSREQISLAVPLIGLAACFMIYLADILLSAHHVRKIWRQSRAQQEPASPDPALVAGPTSTGGYQPITTIGYKGSPSESVNGKSSGQRDLGGNGSRRKAPPPSRLDRVYYDKHGIVGAGTEWQHLTLTIPLDKPRPPDGEIPLPEKPLPADSTITTLDKPRAVDSAVKWFSTSELIEHITTHIQSLGTGDTRVHGFAYGPVPAGKGRSLPPEPSHFTHGLPYLNVCMVVAEPVPKAKKHPVKRVGILRLNYHNQPTADEFGRIADRSPSEHPARHYLRVSSSSWDGQLVASIYLNAALQGHFLRLVIRPYVLAPIVPDLKVADELAERHPLIVTCIAVRATAGHFAWAATRLHDLTIKAGKQDKAATSKSGLRGTREHYAQFSIDNMHQDEDSSRIIAILEQKIIGVTMDFLRDHNIDIGEYEKQVQNYLVQHYTVGTGNIITGGTVTKSPMTNVSGQGNTGTGSAPGA
jgi:hypothetical protein